MSDSETRTERSCTSHTYIVGLTENIHKYYKIGDNVGMSGKFGIVKKGKCRKTKNRVAIKFIAKGRFPKQPQVRATFISDLNSEIEIMKKIGNSSHPNVIQYYDFFEDKEYVYLVMEYCRGGDLFRRLRKKGSYSERDAAFILRQMVLSIKFLHEQRIAHCDIKPENFLFADTNHQLIKIIDFGVSKVIPSKENLHSIVGSPFYIAPEVLDKQYNFAADMWSIGVVMFVMLTGFQPFTTNIHETRGMINLFRLIRQGFTPYTLPGCGPWFPKDISMSPEAKNLITNLLKNDVASRLTADEVLAHPWLREDFSSNFPIDPLAIKGLRNFSFGCKLKQRILVMMSDLVPSSEIKNLKKTFAQLDRNKTGRITMDTLTKALIEIDLQKIKETTETPTPPSPPGLFRRLSSRSKSRSRNNSNSKTSTNIIYGSNSEIVSEVKKLMEKFETARGSRDFEIGICYNDLLLAVVERQLSAKQERLYNAFCKIDRDHDGRITLEDMNSILSEKHNVLNENLFAEVDKDRDGYITYDEFLDMWEQRDPVYATREHESSSFLLPPPAIDTSDVSEVSEFDSEFEDNPRNRSKAKRTLSRPRSASMNEPTTSLRPVPSPRRESDSKMILSPPPTPIDFSKIK